MTLAGLRHAVADPISTALRLEGLVTPTRQFARHASRARRLGIDRIHLVLSSDCDTEDDAAVVRDVHERLLGMGARPMYAVPGALLRRAHDTYAAIAATGAEFMNHGGREHTYFDEGFGRHASCFFYDEQDRGTLEADIQQGDEDVRDVIGRAPTGFRTPHFGTFQSPEQLSFLHAQLRDLGYRWSSSTTPLWGLRYGPVVDRFDVHEFPVSGIPSAPLGILDTWGSFAAPERVRDPSDYLNDALALRDGLAREGAGIINVYGDPLHVHGREEFFEAVAAWLEVAEPATYDEILTTLR